MKINSLVSIITPTYNHENYISKCIEGVLSQDYQNWEQIIINDGSKDNTSKIIQKYKDDRIVFLEQEHQGIYKLGKIYNKGLKISKGEFVAILEGDDFWDSSKLSRQIEVFDDKDIVLSWANGYIVNEKNEKIGVINNSVVKKFKLNDKDVLVKRLLERNFVIPSCTVIIRKEALETIGGFLQPGYAPFVDYMTWLNLAILGKFFFIDEYLGYWRKHKNQTSSNLYKELLYARGKIIIDFCNLLEERNLLGSELNYNLFKAKGNLLIGRALLLKKDRGNSLKEFKISLRNSESMRLKILSFLGLFFSFFNLFNSFERLINFFVGLRGKIGRN